MINDPRLTPIQIWMRDQCGIQNAARLFGDNMLEIWGWICSFRGLEWFWGMRNGLTCVLIEFNFQFPSYRYAKEWIQTLFKDAPAGSSCSELRMMLAKLQVIQRGWCSAYSTSKYTLSLPNIISVAVNCLKLAPLSLSILITCLFGASSHLHRHISTFIHHVQHSWKKQEKIFFTVFIFWFC